MKNLVWQILAIGGITLFGKGMYEWGKADEAKEDLKRWEELKGLIEAKLKHEEESK